MYQDISSPNLYLSVQHLASVSTDHLRDGSRTEHCQSASKTKCTI